MVKITGKFQSTRALREHIPAPRHVIISKWENPYFWYPDGDLNYSQKYMGCKLDLDPSSDFLRKIQLVVFHNPANNYKDQKCENN